MSVYRYRFYDLMSRGYLDTLPLQDVTFTREVRGIGTLAAKIPLYSDGMDARRVMDATIPHRTKIFVERDGTLVWGGRLVPPRDYDSGDRSLSLTAEETLGAFEQRFLQNPTFVQVDQLDIARGIIQSLQDWPGGDMGIRFDGELSGVLRDRTYQESDRTSGLTALTNLSEVIGGFEFATNVGWAEDGLPLEVLLLRYPRLGRRQEATGLVLEYNAFSPYGGNVQSYTWSDGPGLFTKSWATTDTEEGTQLAASVTNTQRLADGYPLLEQVEAFDGITNLQTLADHAAALALYSSGHRVTASFTVKAGPGVEIGDWDLGDDALVRISDWRFPPDPLTGAPGFVGYLRIVGSQVQPGPEGEETYVLTMADFLEAL